jgi:hypothetical protein
LGNACAGAALKVEKLNGRFNADDLSKDVPGGNAPPRKPKSFPAPVLAINGKDNPPAFVALSVEPP